MIAELFDFDADTYPHEYRQVRREYLLAVRKLGLHSGPYAEARSRYLAATAQHTEVLF
jgi:hypothetical protein